MSTYTELLTLKENLTDGDEFMCIVCDNLKLPEAKKAIEKRMQEMSVELMTPDLHWVCLINLYEMLETKYPVRDFDPTYLKYRLNFLNNLITEYQE